MENLEPAQKESKKKKEAVMNIENLKKVNLIDYVRSNYSIECKENGMARCPFHPPDNNPSLSLFTDEEGGWRWYDFHDASGGTIIDFVARKESIDPRDAIKKLIEDFRVVPASGNGTTRQVLRSHIYKDRLGNPVFKKAKYSDGSYGWFHWTRGKWESKKGSLSFIPYNLDMFMNQPSIVICEGEKDADTITSLEIGILATTAPNGKASWPDDLTPHFKQFQNIFVLYDVGNEEDAVKHARKIHEAFPNIRISLAKVPLQAREADITDYLITAEDREVAFAEVLRNAADIDFTKIEKKPGRRSGQTPVLFSLDSYELEDLEWLWPGRFPMGKISIVAGQPGQGKSFFTLYMATQVTTKGRWPDSAQPATEGSVIILSAEDGVADTIKPRAIAMGADVKKINILEGVDSERDGREFFDLSRHIPALEAAVQASTNTRMVIIDPISAYMGSINCHTNAEVRRCLTPLVSLAEKFKVAVVCITHLNKAEGLAAMNRVMDSIALVATARIVWLIGADPKDPSGARKILALLKTNNSGPTRGLAFRIQEDHLVFEHEELDVDPNALLAPGVSGACTSLSIAKEWLQKVLADGAVPADEIRARAREDGIPANALERARRELGSKPRKEGFGAAGRWVWDPSRKRDERVTNEGSAA